MPIRSPHAIRQAQDRALAILVRRLHGTAAGRVLVRGLDPGDADLATRFRAMVAIHEYGDAEPWIRQAAAGAPDILFPGRALALAQTSGTSRGAQAAERYIPQGADLLRQHRAGGTRALWRAAQARPSVLLGRMLMLGGCTALDRSGPVPVGDLSGIIAQDLPWWAAHWHEPGPAVASIGPWPERLAAVAARCAPRDVRLISGIPAWLLMLFDRMRQEGRSVARAWPRLGACIHGGHGIGPFIPALADHLPGDLAMVEVYPASECFLAVGQQAWRLGDGVPAPLELLVDQEVWFEFQADDGTVHGADSLEAGAVYTVLVTTAGGLVRYRLGDRIRAAGPGLVRVAGRLSARLSASGEHLEVDALAQALAAACAASAAVVEHFHVAPVLPGPGQATACHDWLVEFRAPPRDPAVFLAALDDRLQQSALDYRAHRQAGQLTAPRLHSLPRGTVHAWMAARGRLGNQAKVPAAWSDHTLADQLLATGNSP